MWRGQNSKEVPPGLIGLEAVVQREGAPDLAHHVILQKDGSSFLLALEQIAYRQKLPGKAKPYLFYEQKEEVATFNIRSSGGQSRPRNLRKEHLRLDQSVLAQRNDPDTYPELWQLRELYSGIRIYRDWTFGRGASVRQPQPADLTGGWLLPDSQNLAIVLNHLQQQGVWGQIEERLTRLYPRFQRIHFQVVGGTVQLAFQEKGLTAPISAVRVSDGTLHYLALLAVLLNPDPPPIVCLEEPELGLHPDMIPDLAELLQDAATRCQIFVTTHSELLVSALAPDQVIVCERTDLGTTLKRLDPEQLAAWLEDYTLGELWANGEIGGGRW